MLEADAVPGTVTTWHGAVFLYFLPLVNELCGVVLADGQLCFDGVTVLSDERILWTR